IDQLEELGLKVTGFENDNDPDVEKGRATRTHPVAGTEAAVGSEVIPYVSTGQVEVPELRNTSAAEAQHELIKLGLLAVVQQIETNEFSPGIVFEQSPLPGIVNQGTVVTLRVA